MVLWMISTPEYGPHFIERLAEFRAAGLFCDFKLKVEDQEFQVHRLVLAGCSDYFRAMFSHGMIESRTDELCLTAVPLEGIKPLLDYAYSGVMRISIDTLPEILAAATFLQVTPAIRLCHKYLKEKMSFQNADDLVVLGTNFGLLNLKEHQSRMILENFSEFAETDTFLNLDASTLAMYLLDNKLQTVTEGQLLKKVLKWYHHDQKNREKDAFQVFEKVRYVLDGWPCIEYAESIEPFISNPNCKELISWCSKYMQAPSRMYLLWNHRAKVRCEYKTLVQIGGIKGDRFLEFEDGTDRPGSGYNHYHHRELKRWFPLGVNGSTEYRSHCPMVEVNDFGIICGGYMFLSDLSSLHRHFSNEVKLFTAAGFALWDLPFMIEERAKHVAVVAAGYIYCVGGINENGPLSSVERYNLDRELWRFAKPLPAPLYSHAGAAFEHKVYICGGIEAEDVSDRMLCYDPFEQCWEEKQPLLTARYSHTMTFIAGQFIVCGGKPGIGSGRCLSSVESYNLELGQWTNLSPMRLDCCDMSATVLDDKLMIVGGETSVGDLLVRIQEYDPQSKKWGFYVNLPFPTRNAAICALTVKMTEDGQEETDSLEEAYLAKFADSDDSQPYAVEPDVLEDWQFFGDGNHWPQ